MSDKELIDMLLTALQNVAECTGCDSCRDMAVNTITAVSALRG
jgi:hypothetical protein